jgi:GlpG protein
MIAPRNDGQPASLPWLTYLCCVLCVAMTAGFWLVGTNGQPRVGWGALPAEAIWGGRYGGLVTSVFVHGGILHLLFNVLWLARLGEAVERTFGHLEWAIFGLCAAFVAGGAELAVFGGDAIGASGVVYALFGLVWGSRRSVPAFQLIANDDTVRWMLGWMVLCFVLTVMGLWNIANGAHAAGLLFGLAVAWLLVEKPLPPARRALAGGVLAALVILAVMSVRYLPWSHRWQVWQAVHRQAAPLPPER